ncbi:MAG TPA: hypothetical protein VG347_21700 [Verrucomicrobiae bacterium]|nr:hypothetical protein [Verrucomicrobiae bacterium]
MVKIQVAKIALCFLVMAIISIARGQIDVGDSPLILYKINSGEAHGIKRKYILCVNSNSPKDGKTSLIVMGDTFSVEKHGDECWVSMTNTCVLQTHFAPSRTNEVVQIKMWTDGFPLSFPKHTKVVFQSEIVELSKLNVKPSVETGAKVDEGEDALREMKKLGVELPEDIDMEKAIGHKK